MAQVMDPASGQKTNRYCNLCVGTTTHEKTPEGEKCLKCGTPKQKVKPYMSSKLPLEDRILEALGICEEVAKEVKPEDTNKKKSAAGAHRFDDGVEFNEMKYDDQFKYKADQKYLK